MSSSPNRLDEGSQNGGSRRHVKIVSQTDKSILDTVDDTIESLYATHDELGRTVERCMVCTLPLGSCSHTSEWMTSRQKDRDFNPLNSIDVEEELDDMFDLLGDTQAPVQPDFDDASLIGDIDISELQWIELESRKADRIGITDVALWAPDERGWHTSVDCDNKYLIVFGGFRYRKTGVPAPFKSLPNPNEIEVLNDLRIYDIENVSWHAVLDIPNKKRGEEQQDSSDPSSDRPLPPPRFGHVAWYVGESRMMVHGGRGERGRLLCDTWLYHMLENRWELVSNNEMIDSPVPNPVSTSRTFVCQDISRSALPLLIDLLFYCITDILH